MCSHNDLALGVKIILIFLLVPLLRANLLESASQLKLDENFHLETHWLLHTGDICGEHINDIWRAKKYTGRQIMKISDEFAKSFFNLSYDRCAAVCLEKGTPQSHLPYILPLKIFSALDVNIEAMGKWLFESCQSVEVGIGSFHENAVYIYKWNRDGEFGPDWEYLYEMTKEDEWYWENVTLGDVLMAKDNETDLILSVHGVKYDSLWRIGTDTVSYEYSQDVDKVFETLETHWNWSTAVNYTFSELGFEKGRLPDDVFGSMLTYMYNSKQDFGRQDYGGAFELYDADPDLINVPKYLDNIWQTRFNEMMYAWSNTRVTQAPLWGIRKYEEGFRFKFHVDSYNLGMIVNIAQTNVRTPWLLEMFDHAYRLHRIDLSPGEFVFFESGKVLHGRSSALQGTAMYNTMIHFYLDTVPDWATFNPDSPFDKVPGKCWEAWEPSPDCDVRLYPDTLSSERVVAHSAGDLFDYWMLSTPAGTAAAADDESVGDEQDVRVDVVDEERGYESEL